ncbi:helix-turn-helix transcriptional regulator [bacterium]|nr:helix-turn-helix transcriptional regulator [bacterium]
MRLTGRKLGGSPYSGSVVTLGDHLRQRRRELGLRQSDVAKKLGVHRTTLNAWENGHLTPQLRFCHAIEEFLKEDASPERSSRATGGAVGGGAERWSAHPCWRDW